MSGRVCIVHLTCTGACNILLTLMCLVTCSTTKMPKWKAEYQDILAHLFFHPVEWKGTQVMNPRWTFQLKLHLFFLFILFFHFPSFWSAYCTLFSFFIICFPIAIGSSGSHSLPSEGSLHIVHNFSPSLPLLIPRSQTAVAEAIVCWKSKPFSAQNVEKHYRLFFCFLS